MLVVAHGEILLSRKLPHPTSPDWASGKADHPYVRCASEAGFCPAQNKPTHRAWFTPAPLGTHRRLIQQSPVQMLPGMFWERLSWDPPGLRL